LILPTFVVIGAGRCGTTSLYHYLRQHPQVFMSPVKETNFFSYDGPDRERSLDGGASDQPVRTLAGYAGLFARAGGFTAVGEASPRYLYHPQAAERMRALIPEARLVALFRDPVERAYSSYLAYVRDGSERRSFLEAARDEIEGRNPPSWGGKWCSVRSGLYHACVSRYLQLFPRERIRLFLQDDLRQEPAEVLRDVFTLVGVDPAFEPDVSIRYNKSGLARSKVVHRLTGKNRVTLALKRVLPGAVRKPVFALWMKLIASNFERPHVPPEARRMLVAYYRDDVRRFQELIGRDLSAWLAPETPASGGTREAPGISG